MRVRNRADARKRLENSPVVFLQPKDNKGKWREIFGNNNPIHLEIGSGKGKFIHTLAEKNPNINFIAMEAQPTVLTFLLDKVEETHRENLKLISGNAEDLLEYFADEEGTKLVPETREMFYDMNTSKERLIIDELMKGPTNTKLKATIPNDTKVISVTVNEGICYVNFDEGFLNALPDVLDSITIYSIVDSLSELPNISRVQILVNGKSDKNYNSISLGTSVERNLDYVKEEK